MTGAAGSHAKCPLLPERVSDWLWGWSVKKEEGDSGGTLGSNGAALANAVDELSSFKL